MTEEATDEVKKQRLPGVEVNDEEVLVTLGGNIELPAIDNRTLDVRQWPAPNLKDIAEEIKEEDLEEDAFQYMVAFMVTTMYAQRGIGLAGPQINMGKRVFIIDTQWSETGNAYPTAVLNPKIHVNEKSSN